MRSWYVVQTKPHNEKRAVENLGRQGFGVYFPQYRYRRSHARRVEEACRPLFPSYLFVEFDIDFDRWSAIRSTFGVSQLICQGGDPIVVSPLILEEIRTREDSDGMIRLDAARQFRRGDRVTILDGVFQHQTGIFNCRSDADRVEVLLHLLGREVHVSVLDDSIVAAPGH